MGNVSQKQLRLSRENKYPNGTKKQTVLHMVNNELFNPLPTAWKKTGNVNDGTNGRKLMTITRKQFKTKDPNGHPIHLL